MKQWIMMVAVAGLLAGCASKPGSEQAGAEVEDRQAAAAAATPGPAPVTKAKPAAGPDATAKAAPTQTIRVDPLRDPANILSRRSVFFDYDSNAVKEEFKPVVSAHAKHLSTNRSKRVTVQGNTDDRGSREYNLALGQRRADAVKQMMTLLGASAEQIETVSYGEEKPRAQGANEQAWAENRRADIVYPDE